MLTKKRVRDGKVMPDQGQRPEKHPSEIVSQPHGLSTAPHPKLNIPYILEYSTWESYL